MAGKEQFDSFLGGSQTLPCDVHILKLVSSRASEIAAMTHSLENPQQTKLVFQKLPVHMRRRVMSHNSKRLPRRLREAHLNQMTKSGLPLSSKRPSRKYRRRPRNLLTEYNRRQRKKIWLETHIWHAKRFRMVEKWGYRIASQANDKCFKANYRAVAKHCLMQDISYYTCLEINGPADVLKETLKLHCNPYELSFAAKIYVTGDREGTLMFFKKNGFPQFPIGHVHFLWRPSQGDVKSIWIWVHPSFLDSFLEEILQSFEFEADVVASTVSTNSSTSLGSCSYTNNRSCKMRLCRNLNRFRLYGPLTIGILTSALRLPSFDEKFLQKVNRTNPTDLDIEMLNSSESKKEHSTEGVTDINQSWYVEYYNNPGNLESLRIQNQMWQVLKTLASPGQLPPNIVLGFTVLDPRFCLPGKRTKSRNGAFKAEIIPIPLTNANYSPIWETGIRDKVSKACTTTSTINKLRSKCLVPGVSNDKYFNEEIMAKIPILLIQKPGDCITGLSSGIDIILPAGWAMPFWLAFLLRCARVGALRESRSIAFEYGNNRSPDINDPDTAAYAREALDTRIELMEKYFRYPPNRRVNFVKLGISSPFFCEWKVLMREWTNSEETFFVLRNRNLLFALQSNLDRGKGGKKTTEIPDEDVRSKFENKNCLVRVKVTIVNKGCPKNFAIICMPTSEDLQKFDKNRKWSGPVEKLNCDPNETARKTLRKNHLSLLKRLKRQRVRRRKEFVNKLSKTLREDARNLYQQIGTKNLLGTNREIIQKQSEAMSRLYLPECTSVRHSCDREVMGFVTLGDFSFVEAKGVGLGYVTLNSLFQLSSKKLNIVLVRNIQTRQYRIAKLEVVA